MPALGCNCGKLSGHVLAGRPSNRVRCYCTDCQAFAIYCGGPAGILEPHGGTEIIQLSQARLRFDRGIEELACIRLSPRGLLRWYARCCNTPIGNTFANPKLSMIGLVHSCMDHTSLDRDFGAVVADVNTGTALGEPKPSQHGLLPTLGRVLFMVVVDRVAGRYRRSPLFTPDGTPIANAHVLSKTEVEALKRAG